MLEVKRMDCCHIRDTEYEIPQGRRDARFEW